MIVMVGVVFVWYEWMGGEVGYDVYFLMVCGNKMKFVMEMMKWFDMN